MILIGYGKMNHTCLALLNHNSLDQTKASVVVSEQHLRVQDVIDHHCKEV